MLANVESGARYTLAIDALLEMREREEAAMKADEAFDFSAADFLDD